MKNILVVDDETSIRNCVAELLRRDGFQVLSAPDGSKGLQLAREQKPDVILCDIMMPGLDGYDVLTELRRDPATATIPFIFLTAKNDADHHRVGMNLGADDYLTKPFTRANLLKSIMTRLEKNAFYNNQFEEKLEDLRTGLARSLPHDLLNPISVILGYSELLASEHTSMQRNDVLNAAQRIFGAGKRLHRLVQNFLIYAELETLSGEPEKEKALIGGEVSSPGSLIAEVAVEKARQQNRESDLRLELEGAPVKVSEVHLRKIVEELVDNAFRYSTPGSLVSVICRPTRSRLEVKVTDHGRGMNPEQIAGVAARLQFERRIYEGQGSGLGLTIVKRLLALSGGDFELKSIPGRGTSAYAFLPRKRRAGE